MELGNEWLLVELASGLQRLACLSLDRTPAAEILTGTATAWLEALTDSRTWDESRDTPRIRQAFTTLARTSRRWPAPAEFLTAYDSEAKTTNAPRLDSPRRPDSNDPYEIQHQRRLREYCEAQRAQ